MDAATRNLVQQRAGNLCEYCRISQDADLFYSFHVEHVLPVQHGGSDNNENLAWSCPYCNRHKGPNLAGLDPETGMVTRLFHPRRDEHARHFEEINGVIERINAGGTNHCPALAHE